MRVVQTERGGEREGEGEKGRGEVLSKENEEGNTRKKTEGKRKKTKRTWRVLSSYCSKRKPLLT
jgi:hypothetical protein